MGRLIAKFAEKTLLLYQTLKGCLKNKKKQFKWEDEVDATLQKLRDALQQLLTLACPLLGETLQIYLAVSEEAISSILRVEREGK